VAIVAFHFPPQGGAGSLRLLSFARHLPEHGWRPRIVTVGDFGGTLTDRTLAARIPSETDVERWFTSLAAWAYRKSAPQRRTPRSVARGAVRRFLENFASYPDPAIGWSIATGWRLGRRFRENPPRVFMTSSPPHSLHVAGLIASVVADVPWVMDLRDPWMSKPLGIPRLRHFAGRRLERCALATADCVLANTPRLADDLGSASPPPHRVVVLPNGYDEAEIETARAAARGRRTDDAFTIVHAGALYAGQRDPLDFLGALSRALAARGRGRRVRFIIPGESSFHRNPVLLDTARQLGLESSLECPGYVPHDQVLAMMASADLLLLIQGPGFHLQVPSKAYEYLALGRPVLALTGEGATADLVRSSPLGTVVAPGDREEVVRALIAAMERATDPEGPGPPPGVASRRQIAARLADVLLEVEARAT
jgi:glycosyltransferase involved in cell wall biosynthesis